MPNTHTRSQRVLFSVEFIAKADDDHYGRWYVVVAGLRYGIWPAWTDMARYVIGVRRSVHQSFDTRAEAEAYYYAHRDAGTLRRLYK